MLPPGWRFGAGKRTQIFRRKIWGKIFDEDFSGRCRSVGKLDILSGRRDRPVMMSSVFSVALGGALGASARYLAGIGIVRAFGMHGFPMGVICVNVIGSFLMGVFVVAAAHRGLTHLGPFVMTGFLGGFTTFSAFSLETMTLYERGDFGLALLYVLLSVALSVGGLAGGLVLAREIWA